MATTSRQLSGGYFETYSCDFLWSCLPSNFAARPTKGSGSFAIVSHVDQRRYGNLTLDGLNFTVIDHTPTMGRQREWSVGVILDERAAADQQQTIPVIADGKDNGHFTTFTGSAEQQRL
jgi:hypothetical protein